MINFKIISVGRFNPKPSPNSVTQCKKDSSTNGTRVCSSFVPNNCQGGFKIGGNCNQQNRLDNTKLPPSEFQMGESQVKWLKRNLKQDNHIFSFHKGEQFRLEICPLHSSAGKHEYAVST